MMEKREKKEKGKSKAKPDRCHKNEKKRLQSIDVFKASDGSTYTLSQDTLILQHNECRQKFSIASPDLMSRIHTEYG